MHVWLPGAVQAYDGTTNLADVQVLVEHPVFDDDGRIDEYENLGVLAGVPVGFYRAGGFYMSGPVAAGDEGILLFASTAIGEWRNSGQRSQPKDPARHSLGYPYFLPCAFNDTRTLPDATARAAGLVIGKEGSSEQIRIATGSIQAGASGASPLPTQADYNALLAALSVFLAPANWGTITTAGAAAAKLLTDIQGTGPEPCKPAFTTLFTAK